METASESDGQALPRRSGVRWRHVLLAAGLVVVVAMAVTFVVFRRQTISYVTHRKGGPSITWPYEVHDPPAEFHLAVAGDGGDGGTRIDATGEAAAQIDEQEPYDGLLFLGDNVYPAGDPSKLPDTVFEPFADVLDGGADLMAILGNHDVKKGRGDEQMEVLGMPGRYWAEEHGDVLIIGLDSNEIDDPAQLEFLDDTLAATDATWRIVAVHHPPYSAGYQGSSVDVRESIAPFVERYGVQLVLSGHDHDYQRSTPIDGVTYVVSGGASGTRRTGEADFTEVAYSWHNFVDIAITGDQLVLRAIGQDGSVFDEVTLTST
ncbi:MAG TPA: metallophosphoesterase [Ilumatobacteraceae bacterium]|nr:metallophosphoesterase [Ilumatobacteraceae bacterium]